MGGGFFMSYYRIFIMMQENDGGYSKGGKLSGYLKMEQNHSKIKALVHIQNIGLPKSSQILKAYVLSSAYPGTEPLYLGVLHLQGNTGSVFYECNKKNLAECYADLSKLDTAVVMCTDTKENSSEITFPL